MIRCNNCGADIEETQTQCPYCHAMQYEASEKEYMNHLYKMNDTMDGLDENANCYIRNRIICHAVITLAAVAAALLVGTASSRSIMPPMVRLYCLVGRDCVGIYKISFLL